MDMIFITSIMSFIGMSLNPMEDSKAGEFGNVGSESIQGQAQM